MMNEIKPSSGLPPYVVKAVELGAERIRELEKELKIAVRFLNEGKQKFTPNTTNSHVDDFLEKHKELLK
jgi:hypothetical protein